MNTKILLMIGIIASLLILTGCGTGNVTYDTEEIVNEKQTEKKIEAIEITGSDTLLQVVSSLAEAYKSENPSTRISVTGGGSGTGIASLINGDIDIADSSRKIKDSELKQATEKGLEVIEVPIARDTLSVIVHPSNSVKQLTIEQVSKIYKGDITNWKDVGGYDKEITLYGRQSTSGTYAYFMEEVVKADYSPEMRNMEGNQAIVDAVSQDKSGIGYVGVGYIMDLKHNAITTITTLKIAKDINSEYITPLDEASIDTYPISRELYQYLAQKPLKDSAVYGYIMFVLSEEGQKVVEDSGFIPLNSMQKSQTIQKITQ